MLNSIDKNIYSENSVFFSGSFNNTAVKVAAVAATITSLSVSVHLISAFGGVYGAILISGTIIADAGGSIWYQYRINEIQNVTRELFDQIYAHAQEEEMCALLKSNDISIYGDFSPRSFFDVEFILRLKTTLKNKENFQNNFHQLKSLLNSHNVDSKYKFLAKRILELDDEDKTFILNQDLPEFQRFIYDMMVDIRYETTIFTELYKFIPDSIRKNILISLGDSCFRYIEEREDYSTTEHFGMALKSTPELPRLVKEIFSENPQVEKMFSEALPKVFSKEFNHVKETEASARFLIDLYPLLNESGIARAFYVDTQKEMSLQLWMEVVSKTEVAVYANFIESLFHKPYFLSPSFYECLRKNWNQLQDGLNAICQDLPVETPFSLFVHFLSSGLSEKERDYVQNMKVFELGTLVELDPRFIQVWMENKIVSIPEKCKDYIQYEPSTNRVINFFKGLTLEQKFEWIQSNQRLSIDFKNAKLMYFKDLSMSLIAKQSQLEVKIMCERSHYLLKPLQSHVASIKAVGDLLRREGLEGFYIEMDLLLLWQDIQAIKSYPKTTEWMSKLYNWGMQTGNARKIEGLIYAARAIDNYDYVQKLNNLINQTTNEAPCEELPVERPPEATKEDVIAAIRALGLNPAVEHTKLSIRKLLIKYHSDQNKEDPDAVKKFQAYFPLVKLIIDYMEKNDLTKTPVS